MCLILQYIAIYTTTNQAKMKATNIYDGVVMIFFNDPLSFCYGKLGKKIEDKDVWKSWTYYYIFE
jgi:hypothetical protein